MLLALHHQEMQLEDLESTHDQKATYVLLSCTPNFSHASYLDDTRYNKNQLLKEALYCNLCTTELS